LPRTPSRGPTPTSARTRASRLAEASNKLQSLRANINEAIRTYSDAWTLPDAGASLFSIGHAIRWNNLKITASEMTVDIVRDAMTICGMAGFSNDSKFSMARQLRDATSAHLMITNDRIHTTNANLLLVHKDD
jgi:acyl-CoA dehydrogenase